MEKRTGGWDACVGGAWAIGGRGDGCYKGERVCAVRVVKILVLVVLCCVVSVSVFADCFASTFATRF